MLRPRLRTPLTWYFSLFMIALAASACGGDSGRSALPGDRTSNGNISIDESALHATLSGSMLDVAVPVRALKDAEGSLEVSLRSVDDTKVLDQTRVSYALETGEHRRVIAHLALPKSVVTQADRVLYSVRVETVRDLPLRVTRSLLHVLSPYELTIEGPGKLRSAKPGSYRVKMTDPVTHAALSDAPVKLVLSDEKGAAVRELQAVTGDDGSAVFELDVQTAGAYQVSAQSTESGAALELSEAITVTPNGRKLLVTTDKPLYQPSQLIHLRALALESPSNEPVKAQEVVFEIEDGKGNKVYKQSETTDDFGIVSTSFRLASIVNMGTYKVRALLGGVTGEKTVEVSRYALPKFEVKIGSDKAFYAPAQKVSGTVDSRYFFGKDVAGAKVELEALTLDVGENVFARVMGMTDANGHMAFSVTLPDTLAGLPIENGNALVTLRATVTDTAGQIVTKEKALTVANAVVNVTLVPEGKELVPGIDNRLHLFANDPLGNPVGDADVLVTLDAGKTQRATTDAFGHVEVHWTPTSSSSAASVKLTTPDGDEVFETFTFQAQQGESNVLVRTDKSIYRLGEAVKVQVFVSKDERVVYVDWLNAGQAVDMRTLDAQDGVASFDMTLDTSLFGENRIEAYVVGKDGNTTRSGRTIVVNRESALRVSLETDAPEYKPGAPAKLTFTVTDQQGNPKPAALGVQIVDEAVFGLIDARPGLLRTFFELEDSFAKPTYEIETPHVSFDKLLFEDAMTTDPMQVTATQALGEACLVGVYGNSMMGIHAGSWPETLERVKMRLISAYAKEKTALLAQLQPHVVTAARELAAIGCTPETYYCDSLGLSFFDALGQRVRGRVVAYDFWGNRYQSPTQDYRAASFTTRGPDELADSGDDNTITLEWSDFGLDVWKEAGFADGGVAFGPVPEFGGNFGNDQGAGAAGTGGGLGVPTAEDSDSSHDGSGTDASPRVRKEFPETLYVNPALITDANGKATVSLDMADSITSWRVSSLANAQDGMLGGGQSGITVFQDFFVDVSFPAELTRGDEVDFPIVVYNYLKVPQTVKLEIEAAAWFSALGSTNPTLTLAAGEVASVHVPVRVEQVGTQTLTVHAIGDGASDAVARSVRVIPDGLAVPLAQSGSLGAGSSQLSATFPANAVPGSGTLYLDVFPAFLAQAVQGLDSLLQTPSGCFEQTTSTTWPNVLVTQYMQQTKQITPSIQLKAESLISAGYQRLLTFEHTGGGFSWFGEQDPAPFLSVTAFGLMEFADMANVQEVDDAMRARTRAWLLAQQKADGSWPGDQTEFFSFQTSTVRNTAFVLWALAQDGASQSQLQSGLDYVKKNLATDEDAYTLALAANAFALAAPNDAEVDTLLNRLDGMKTVSGEKASWDSGDTQTNFYGAGNDAAVSTTALAAHAMLIAGGHAASVKQALEFITASKDSSGNFGSTQATVWALKTLLLAALKGTEGAVGTLDVKLDGTAFATVNLTKAQSDVMTRVDMSALATVGAHTIDLAFVGTGRVSYNLVSSHHIPWSDTSGTATGPLSVSIAYDRTTLAVDETVTATVTIANQTASTQNMLLVTVGIPPGFDVLGEDLDAHKAAGELSHYETTGKQLILYLTALGPNGSQAIDYRLRATMPVKAVDGGAEVHPYYEPEKTSQAESQLLTASM